MASTSPYIPCKHVFNQAMNSISPYFPCTRVFNQWRDALNEQPVKNLLQAAFKISLFVLSYLAHLPALFFDLILLPVQAIGKFGFHFLSEKKLSEPSQLKEIPQISFLSRHDYQFLENAIQLALQHMPEDRRKIFEDLIDNQGASKKEGFPEIEIFQWMASVAIARCLLIGYWYGFGFYSPPCFLCHDILIEICGEFGGRCIREQETIKMISAIFFLTPLEKISPTIRPLIQKIRNLSSETTQTQSFRKVLIEMYVSKEKTSNQYDHLVQYS